MNAAFRTVATIAAVALAYFATAHVGLVLALVKGQVTPLWLPTGISVAALFLFGGRIAPGIALAANVTLNGLGPAVLITAGNTAAPLAAWYLLTRCGFRTELDRLKDALLLVFVGAFGAMLVSALAGAFSLRLFGIIQWHEVAAVFSVW